MKKQTKEWLKILGIATAGFVVLTGLLVFTGIIAKNSQQKIERLKDGSNMFTDEQCEVMCQPGCPCITGEAKQGTPYGVNSIKDFEILFTLKSEVGNGGKVEATFTPEFDCQKDSMDLIEQSIEESLLFKNPK